MAGCFEEENKTSGTNKGVEFLHKLRSLVHGVNRLKAPSNLPVRAEKLHILSYNIRVFMFWNFVTNNRYFFTLLH